MVVDPLGELVQMVFAKKHKNWKMYRADHEMHWRVLTTRHWHMVGDMQEVTTMHLQYECMHVPCTHTHTHTHTHIHRITCV